ncbi:unnamed protein product [Cyclocybe aegerita]|uniref:Uncharacterized protein n=1 Tax=Cyclocybe aegerita TaxID=1973307 RepID=A0A8S0VZI0_CYCAE|nr:unnamed protein product [Cyclocybe aegerita]
MKKHTSNMRFSSPGEGLETLISVRAGEHQPNTRPFAPPPVLRRVLLLTLLRPPCLVFPTMSTLLTRHACRALRAQAQAFLPARSRTIHATATLQKKKGKTIIDDLFEDDAFSPDALSAASTTTTSTTSPTSTASLTSNTPAGTTQKSTAFKRLKLPPTERARRFSAELAFVEPRIGRSPTVKTPHIRKRVWFGLLDLAQSEEELRRVVGLWPAYVAGRERERERGVYPEGLAGDFVRRCAELKCPNLALEVFGDWARYNLDLDLSAARWLVHSLAIPLVAPSTYSPSSTPSSPPQSSSQNLEQPQPLDNLLLALSLYPIYALPPVSSDLPTAAMAASACFAHGGDKAVRLAEELVPCIAGLVAQSSNSNSTVEEGKGSGVGKEKKEGKAKGKVQGVKVAKGKEGKAKEKDIERAMVEKWTKGALRRVSKEVEKRTGKGLDLGRLEGVVQIQSAKLAPGAEATL